MDDEVIGIARDALRRRSWDESALDVDDMVEGALAGSFLSSKRTRTYLRSDYRSSTLSFDGGREEWEAGDRTSVVDAAAERVRDALAHDPAGLPDDIFAELCRLIDACARELGLAEWPDPRRLLDVAQEVA
jgi:trimethylamine:corrinoid methyltransferase-like protein